LKRVTVVRDNTKKVLAQLRGLERKQCLVGVPDSTADRKSEEDQGPFNNAAIGYLMERGSPAMNLPARPSLVPGIAEVQDKIAERYKSGAKAVLDGRLSDADQVHEAAGLIAEAAVKAKITDGDFAPLAARTIAARRARGRTSIKPLVDTGQFRNSITHVIRPKG
jgi:hypothetical protein